MWWRWQKLEAHRELNQNLSEQFFAVFLAIVGRTGTSGGESSCSVLLQEWQVWNAWLGVEGIADKA
jgi:hypothetical protein